MVVGDLRSMPWPSDVMLASDGRLAVSPPFPFSGQAAAGALLADALSELDGFGTVTSVFFPVNAAVEVDAGAAATLVDLEGSDPPRGSRRFTGHVYQKQRTPRTRNRRPRPGGPPEA